MADKLYWVWMACALGPATEKGETLLRRFGTPKAVFEATWAEIEKTAAWSENEKRALDNRNLKTAQSILTVCEKTGVGLLTMGDREYPERLVNIFAPPLVLYVRGALPDIDNEVLIAVVGTRKMTPYGKIITQKLSGSLACAGVIVVSGLARGNDTEAALGAIKGGGKTIAVLGSGIDVCYPSENHRLLEEIVQTGGAVISEYPPGTPPYASNFPQRNRLISGISLGTLVVEAPEKSGSLITANLALEQGRDVFAVPGSIHNPASFGANKLLQLGAKPVICVEDILEEYEGLYPQKINMQQFQGLEEPGLSPEQPWLKVAAPGAQTAQKETSSQPQSLSPDEEKVAMSLSREPLHIDDIALSCGLSARQVSAVLTLLELKGLACSHPGGRYSGI